MTEKRAKKDDKKVKAKWALTTTTIQKHTSSGPCPMRYPVRLAASSTVSSNIPSHTKFIGVLLGIIDIITHRSSSPNSLKREVPSDTSQSTPMRKEVETHSFPGDSVK
jgi:hypothetical protein